MEWMVARGSEGGKGGLPGGVRRVTQNGKRENILSTFAGNSHGRMSGTSLAAPHVTGAAALFVAAKPDAAVDDLKTALLGSVDQNGSPRGR
jgi:subtilisin family serine protease